MNLGFVNTLAKATTEAINYIMNSFTTYSKEQVYENAFYDALEEYFEAKDMPMSPEAASDPENHKIACDKYNKRLEALRANIADTAINWYSNTENSCSKIEMFGTNEEMNTFVFCISDNNTSDNKIHEIHIADRKITDEEKSMVQSSCVYLSQLLQSYTESLSKTEDERSKSEFVENPMVMILI